VVCKEERRKVRKKGEEKEKRMNLKSKEKME
jgi:hypothetical protein